MDEATSAAPAGPRPSISKGDLLAYSLPQFPHSMALLPVVNFVPAFYASDMGMKLGLVGFALFLTRLTDIITDPLVGAWSDRTRSRFGRRKPFIVAGLPLLMASTWFVFVPPGQPSFLTLFAGLFFMYLGFTIVDLPYGAWGAELSDDYDERTRIAGWKAAAGALGTMAALAIPVVLQATGRGGAGNALFGMAVAFCILQPIAFAYALWRTPERPPETLTPARTYTGREKLAVVFANRPFIRLVIAGVFIVGGLSVGAVLNLIFTTHVIGAPEAFPYIIFFENVASFVGLPAFLWIARRFGKHRAFVAGGAWYMIGNLLCLLWGPGDVWPFAITRVACGLALMGLVVIGPSMTADVIDQDLLETGEERTGTFFAISSMATKASIAVGVLVGSALPALVGFEPSDRTHSDTALLGLRLVYSAGSALLILPGVLLAWNYGLTREVQHDLRRRIEARKAGASA